MKYNCLRCGMEFKQKCHFLDHLNRKNICEPIDDFISIYEVKKHYGFDKNHKNIPNDSISLQNDSILLQNDSIVLQNDSISLQNENNFGSKKLHLAPNSQNLGSKKLHLAPFSGEPEVCSENQCKYCLKFYSKISNLNKHLKNCKKKKEVESVSADETEELKKEIKELKETMKMLINNSDSLSGNTTNNNNNTTNNNNNNNNTNCNNDNSMNIHINNYGSENKDYITKDYLIKLLREPFQAIPRLIEYTHFNKDHPENQNIKLPNKKQPYVKVLKDDKWVYADRKTMILDLIDEKHSELNEGPLITHIEEKFSEHLQDRFERFNDRYLNDEKIFTNQLYKETELVMINNR